MKINAKIIEEAITKVLKESLDYNAADLGIGYEDEIDPMAISDAEYDEMMDKYLADKPDEAPAQCNCDCKDGECTCDCGEELPFESKKSKKNVINENTIRTMVRECISSMIKENYPPGAQYDPRAPWNQSDPESESKTVYGTAYYINQETEEEKQIPFQVNVEVEGETVDDWDEEGYCGYFEPYEDTDYAQLVKDSGEVPETLEGGFTLEDIDVEDIY